MFFRINKLLVERPAPKLVPKSDAHAMRRRSVLAALAASALLPTLDARASDAEPLRIGVLFPLTGTMSLLGQETFDGALIALDLINTTGGVNGSRVEFVLADAPTGEAARREAERLISQESVTTILGPYGSAQAFAAAEVTERHKVVLWVDTAWSSALFAKKPRYVFRTSTYATPVAEAAIAFSKNTIAPTLGADAARIALVHEDGPYGESVARELQAAAEKAGVTIDKVISYDRAAPDLAAAASAIKAAEPDLLYAVSFPDDAARLVESLGQLNFWPKAIMTTSTGWGIYTLPEAIGSKAENIFVANAPAVVDAVGLNQQGRTLSKEFSNRFRIKRGREPSAFAAMGFVAAYSLLHDVLPNAKDPRSAEDVRTAAGKADVPIGSYPNGWGLRMDASGQNLRTIASIDQWQDGGIVTVAPSGLAVRNARLPSSADQ